MANQEKANWEEDGKIEKLPRGKYTIDGTVVKVGILGQVVEFDMRHITYCAIRHECEPKSSYICLAFPDATASTRVIRFRIDDNEKLFDLAQNIHCYYMKGGQS